MKLFKTRTMAQEIIAPDHCAYCNLDTGGAHEATCPLYLGTIVDSITGLVAAFSSPSNLGEIKIDPEIIKIPKDDEILVIKMGDEKYPVHKAAMDQMRILIQDLGLKCKVLILTHAVHFQKIEPENHYIIKVGTDKFPADDDMIEEIKSLLSESLKNFTVVKHNLEVI